MGKTVLQSIAGVVVTVRCDKSDDVEVGEMRSRRGVKKGRGVGLEEGRMKPALIVISNKQIVWLLP